MVWLGGLVPEEMSGGWAVLCGLQGAGEGIGAEAARLHEDRVGQTVAGGVFGWSFFLLPTRMTAWMWWWHL